MSLPGKPPTHLERANAAMAMPAAPTCSMSACSTAKCYGNYLHSDSQVMEVKSLLLGFAT